MGLHEMNGTCVSGDRKSRSVSFWHTKTGKIGEICALFSIFIQHLYTQNTHNMHIYIYIYAFVPLKIHCGYWRPTIYLR